MSYFYLKKEENASSTDFKTRIRIPYFCFKLLRTNYCMLCLNEPRVLKLWSQQLNCQIYYIWDNVHLLHCHPLRIRLHRILTGSVSLLQKVQDGLQVKQPFQAQGYLFPYGFCKPAVMKTSNHSLFLWLFTVYRLHRHILFHLISINIWYVSIIISVL